MDNEKYREYLKSDKWRRIAAERMRIDGNKCVMCGCRGTTANPLEVHHLSYKWLYQEDQEENHSRIYQSLCTLCHADHKAVHAMMNRQTSADGRHGWKDNSTIPTVSVFTLSGDTLEHIELKGGKRYE